MLSTSRSVASLLGARIKRPYARIFSPSGPANIICQIPAIINFVMLCPVHHAIYLEHSRRQKHNKYIVSNIQVPMRGEYTIVCRLGERCPLQFRRHRFFRVHCLHMGCQGGSIARQSSQMCSLQAFMLTKCRQDPRRKVGPIRPVALAFMLCCQFIGVEACTDGARRRGVASTA